MINLTNIPVLHIPVYHLHNLTLLLDDRIVFEMLHY